MRRALALLCVAVVPLLGQTDLPRLTQRVTDFTNTLSYAEWSSLEREIKNFEDTTSNQIAIVLASSVGDMSIEEYASRTFEENRLGQAGKDNGVLIVIAFDSRQIRIEVGYGLEGVLTDAMTRQIIEKEMKPRFRDDQYFGGLIAAVYAIAGAVGGEYTVDDRGTAAPTIGFGTLIALMIILSFVLRPFLARRRRAVLSTMGPVYYSGWGWRGGQSGGSGFGGGGFGGFSGGGGLSGGGGATGSW